MPAGDRQRRAVGRNCDRGYHRRDRIFLGRDVRIANGGDFARNRIVLRALLDPASQDAHFDARQLLPFVGHLGIVPADLLDERAFLRIAGDERRAGLSAMGHGGISRQIELALHLLRTMTAGTAMAQDRADVVPETDRFIGGDGKA